jgi:hypothetical protein
MNPNFTQTPPGHSMTVLPGPYRRIAIILPKMEPGSALRRAVTRLRSRTVQSTAAGAPLLGERPGEGERPLYHFALRASNSALRDAGNQPLTPISPTFLHSAFLMASRPTPRASHLFSSGPKRPQAAHPHKWGSCKPPPQSGNHLFRHKFTRRKKFIRSQAVPGGLMRTEAVRLP